MLQPALNIDELTAFLERWAGGPVGGISQFSNGQISSVFAFEVKGDFRAVLRDADPRATNGRYVVRFVPVEHGEGLKKDRFFAPRAAAVGVPVPRVVAYGELRMMVANMNDEDRASNGDGAFPLAYSICDRMPGEHIGDLQDKDRRHLLPAVVETIDRISAIDISDSTGYGWSDSEGNAKHASWLSYIVAESFPEDGGSFYERRRDWFTEGFLEFDVFRHFSDQMMSIASGLPEVDRSATHNDFGYDNVLVVGSEVSAVLDWDNSIIGDHLYDGAWNDVYASEPDYKRLFAEQYEKTGRDVPSFDDRWRVCQLHVVLQTLGWYGRSHNEAAYHWMKDRMKHLLGEGSAVGRHPGAP